MMRLIDADELLNTPIRVTGKIPLKNGHVQTIEAISVREIENAPTIDPESLRPHGEWVYGEDIDIQCSACGADALTAGDYRQVKSNYCPNCGAKMGEKEETE